MTAPSKAINKLRRDIDVIDDEMHDLLMRRVEIVEQVGALKDSAPGDGYMRPAREAQILRRLLKRHKGNFPAAVVARLWRELLTSMTRLQGPFNVAVYAPEKSVGFWDIARDHYGSATAMSLHRSAAPVLDAVFRDRATVGLLPLPAEGEADPWWPKLIVGGDNLPKVIARVPFIENGDGRFEDLGALAIARTSPGKSGVDISLYVVEAASRFSRSSIQDAFAKAGLAVETVASWSEKRASASHLYLMEVDGFVKPDDSRIAAIVKSQGKKIIRIADLGGYAVPIRRDKPAKA